MDNPIPKTPEHVLVERMDAIDQAFQVLCTTNDMNEVFKALKSMSEHSTRAAKSLAQQLKKAGKL